MLIMSTSVTITLKQYRITKTAAIRRIQSDVTELNWHGLDFDKLTNGASPSVAGWRGQNVWMVGAVLLMRQGSNGKIRSLPTWQLISPGAFTVTPWWRPSAWQLSAAHGEGYGATSPASADAVTNQVSTHIQMPRVSLDKSRSNPIW